MWKVEGDCKNPKDPFYSLIYTILGAEKMCTDDECDVSLFETDRECAADHGNTTRVPSVQRFVLLDLRLRVGRDGRPGLFSMVKNRSEH